MGVDRPLPHHSELECYALGAVLRDNGNWCLLEGLPSLPGPTRKEATA